MSKELEALQKLRDLVENLTRIDYVPTDLRNEVKELIIKSYEDSDGLFSQIEEALNELEDAKHNYRAVEEMHNNSVAYGTRIQKELNELKKRNEPMKIKHENNGIPYCSNCERTYLRNTLGNENNYCGYCGQALDWSKDAKNE